MEIKSLGRLTVTRFAQQYLNCPSGTVLALALLKSSSTKADIDFKVVQSSSPNCTPGLVVTVKWVTVFKSSIPESARISLLRLFFSCNVTLATTSSAQAPCHEQKLATASVSKVFSFIILLFYLVSTRFVLIFWNPALIKLEKEKRRSSPYAIQAHHKPITVIGSLRLYVYFNTVIILPFQAFRGGDSDGD